jgi:hypothetical protein
MKTEPVWRSVSICLWIFGLLLVPVEPRQKKGIRKYIALKDKTKMYSSCGTAVQGAMCHAEGSKFEPP